MALPETLFNVRPFTSSLTLVPVARTLTATVPWPWAAADGCGAGLGAALFSAESGVGGGADSYGNFFLPDLL